MILVFKQNLSANPQNLLRDCGYFEIRDRKTGKTSYVRKLRGDSYPRFHVYIQKEGPGFLQLNMHLDMKKPVYEGATAHSGEYEGPLVENEASRIKSIIANSGPATKPPPEEKKSFLGGLFSSRDDDN